MFFDSRLLNSTQCPQRTWRQERLLYVQFFFTLGFQWWNVNLFSNIKTAIPNNLLLLKFLYEIFFLSNSLFIKWSRIFERVKRQQRRTMTLNDIVSRSVMDKRISMVGYFALLEEKFVTSFVIFLACILASELNKLIKEKRLCENSIIKLENVVHNLTSTGKWVGSKPHLSFSFCRPFLSVLDLTILPTSTATTPKQSNTSILPIDMVTPYINGMYALKSVVHSSCNLGDILGGKFVRDVLLKAPFDHRCLCAILILLMLVEKFGLLPSEMNVLDSIRSSKSIRYILQSCLLFSSFFSLDLRSSGRSSENSW